MPLSMYRHAAISKNGLTHTHTLTYAQTQTVMYRRFILIFLQISFSVMRHIAVSRLLYMLFSSKSKQEKRQEQKQKHYVGQQR